MKIEDFNKVEDKLPSDNRTCIISFGSSTRSFLYIAKGYFTANAGWFSFYPISENDLNIHRLDNVVGWVYLTDIKHDPA